MKSSPGFNTRRFLLGAALVTGMGCSFPSFAQPPYPSYYLYCYYLVDVNSGGLTPLGAQRSNNIFPTVLNDSGQVVGLLRTTTGQYHVFITGADGIGMTDLGDPPGVGPHDGFSVSGINDAGQVAGYSQTLTEGSISFHAFASGPNGANMRNLATLGEMVVWLMASTIRGRW
jgi:probable HAF family extracellular repeat protein